MHVTNSAPRRGSSGRWLHDPSAASDAISAVTLTHRDGLSRLAHPTRTRAPRAKTNRTSTTAEATQKLPRRGRLSLLDDRRCAIAHALSTDTPSVRNTEC